MNGSQAKQVSTKEKVVHEIRQLVAIFLYLSAFFTVFRFYTRLVLAEYQINYFVYGLTLLKSLALAKVVLTGEALHLGERLRGKPAIVPTIYKTIVFCAFALAFEVLEHLVIGWARGKGPTAVLSEIADKGWPHLLAMTMVVFVAFIPFFAFQQVNSALGQGRLADLFFKPGARRDIA